MNQFLRYYRATPHCTMGVAPATTLLGDQLEPSHPSLFLSQVVKFITRNHAPQRCSAATQDQEPS